MLKTITKEDLEQSLVPPARKGDVVVRGKDRWVLPYDLIWRRNIRWPAHQGYWSLALPHYRYGVVHEGDTVEVADDVASIYFPYPEKTEWHHRLETPDYDSHKGDWHVYLLGADGAPQRADKAGGVHRFATHAAASEHAWWLNKKHCGAKSA